MCQLVDKNAVVTQHNGEVKVKSKRYHPWGSEYSVLENIWVDVQQIKKINITFKY